MKNKQDWFSIVIALFLVLAMVLTAQYILSYIIPFWKNTKWIEHSVKAYYEATKSSELAIYQIKDKKIQLNNTDWSGLAAWNVENIFNIEWKSNIIPPAGKWNSDFNKNANKLSLSEPIQLILTNNSFDLNAITLKISTPDIVTKDEDWNNPQELIDLNVNDKDWNALYHNSNWDEIITKADIPIIGWSLSSKKNTLTGTSFITLWDINNNWGLDKSISVLWLSWKNLQEKSKWLVAFYQDTVSDEWIWACGATEDNKCILKFNLINKLKVKADKDFTYPYLEYQINLWWTVANTLLTKDAHIVAEWKSYWFKRDIELEIPQEATNAAFDFTIMQ